MDVELQSKMDFLSFFILSTHVCQVSGFQEFLDLTILLLIATEIQRKSGSEKHPKGNNDRI